MRCTVVTHQLQDCVHQPFTPVDNVEQQVSHFLYHMVSKNVNFKCLSIHKCLQHSNE